MGVTVSVIDGEDLVGDRFAPRNSALIWWTPTARWLVENDATEPVMTPVPRVRLPSMKITFWTGFPVVGSCTTKVTVSPKTGRASEATRTDVGAGTTVRVPFTNRKE